jgi:hypothetical protein
MQEYPVVWEPHERTMLEQRYAAIDGWMANDREACPDDPREDLDILVDATVYHAASPYWPLENEEVRGAQSDLRQTRVISARATVSG